MTAHQSPFDGSETASCSTPGFPPETRKRKRSSVSIPQPAREYGLMRDSGEHDIARFVGSSSGIHYIRAVYLRLARRSASRATRTAKSNLVPGEDDQLRDVSSSTGVLWKSDEAQYCSQGDKPAFEDLLEWSKSYFECWHPVLPFLHGPDVLRSFEEISDRGYSGIDPLDLVIVKSILSISLADSRQRSPLEKPVPLALLFNSFEAAVASSQFALSQPATIKATQAALAIQLFLASMLCLNSASRLGGLIVRMAYHLGLHRCPARFPFFSPEVASLRRRVFWCIYTLERLLCQSLGLPLDIQDDDLDVCYPGEERHHDPREAILNDEPNRLQLLTLMAKHARIRGLILELRSKSVLQRQDTTERTAYVQTELAKWANEIQDIVEDPYQDSSTISSSHRLMLRTLKYESIISLNRPGLAAEFPDISYSSAFQACISAAKSICIDMKRHVTHHRLEDENDAKRLHLPLLWPSFTWTVWISVFVLIHAAFENQTPMKSVLRHAVAAKDVLSYLAARGTSWPEYCLEATDELISAVEETSTRRSAPHLPTSASNPAAVSDTDEVNIARPRMRQGTMSGHISRRPDSVSTNENTASTLIETSNTDKSHTLQQPAVSQHLGVERTEALTQQLFEQPTNGMASNGRVDFASSLAFSNASYPVDIAENTSLEGQESMKWYDHMFSSSFSAIDNPFLVAAEFDATIDPTWSYLR
ncbi:fungal-specific transcription factor domain-containing protein [Stachybotrys elegans]|uniref:Fungal-specific transcription factor domain-containing protein n=1 Tax=Stachybotrys elegans TaxID=80388 RepID=A0A8K0SDV3_9HYPO|nr:fungal-specific transcription factor domain-containing protein [Stachybotrys elegans]